MLAGPRQGGKTTFLFGQPEPEAVERGTFMALLLQSFFNEVLRETTMTNDRQLDIAVKMGVIDC